VLACDWSVHNRKFGCNRDIFCLMSVSLLVGVTLLSGRNYSAYRYCGEANYDCESAYFQLQVIQ
jgi:hypothetical protein